jgi:hypothetical protein
MSVGKFPNPVNECWENGLKFPSHTQLKKGLYVLGKDEILLCVLGKSDVCWEIIKVHLEWHTYFRTADHFMFSVAD